MTPVHILQASVSVVGHLYTKILLIMAVPELGNVVRMDGSFDQSFFKLVAYINMKMVADLVGLCSDE